MPVSHSTLETPSGTLSLPCFLPDATLGVVRGLDSVDNENTGVTALVMNTFHLMQRPGATTIKAMGGLHRYAGWSRPILTDSGGFQAYSLIRENPKNGSLNERGFLYRPEQGEKLLLTPEKTIQLQMAFGSDILVVLDDPTHPDDPDSRQKVSVDRTIAWARRSKAEFERLLAGRRNSARPRPLLFGVIQGGRSLDLRQECTQALLEMGFDGFGYGGWPVDREGDLLEDVFSALRAWVPAHLPLHALGVGHPRNIVHAARLGWDTFDSTMPTRDARHGRLYAFSPAYASEGLPADRRADWFDYIYVDDKRHLKSNLGASAGCDCLLCKRYSLGYLHHLFKIGDSLYMRLATIHNLRFMILLMERLAEESTAV